MPDDTVISIPFVADNGESPVGPLTWGQRFMWDIIAALAPHDEHINLEVTVPVPAGLSMTGLSRALARLIERHAVLRTRYYAGDDAEPYQVEIQDGRLQLHVRRTSSADPTRCTGELIESLVGRSFDLASGIPVRLGVCIEGEQPRVVVLALSHIVSDAWGLRILRRDLQNLLSGKDSDNLPFPGRTPLEQVEYEQSESGRQVELESLEHWNSRLRQFPRTMFDVPAMPPAAPRYWRGTLSSPALGLGTMALMRRYRVSSNSVVLAALALHIGYLTGRDSCALMVRVNNRGGDINQAVGYFTQEVPVVFGIDQDSFESTVRSVQNEVLRSIPYGRYSPPKVWRLRDQIDEERGTRTTIDSIINTVQVTAEAPRAYPSSADELLAELNELRPRSEFAWEVKRENEAIKLLVDSWLPIGNGLSLLADTAYISPDNIKNILFGIEGLVIHVATVGDQPSDVIPASGISPVRRAAPRRRQ
ncbi:MAG TPA: condensation domain-containing protein [Streptosporangiaceae bacterium]|nr:condensation domain-containing protein [Streptosporangiaceae bacterium]